MRVHGFENPTLSGGDSMILCEQRGDRVRMDRFQDKQLLEDLRARGRLFRSVARLRGMECAAPETFAGAFHCHKAVS